MNEVILHIGHGKTGTSALQTAFALNAEVMRTQGILYPDHPSLKRARKGETTSGNMRAGSILATVQPFAGSDGKILVSNEQVFDALASDLSEIEALKREGFDPLVLLLIRDPLDDARSAYSQSIKRGKTFTFSEFLGRYSRPTKVHALLSGLAASGTRYRVLNYSKRKRTVVPDLMAFLGVADFEENPQTVINRSLTGDELEIQRAFNQVIGLKAKKLIADPLIQSAPDATGAKPVATKAELAAFHERMVSECGLVAPLIDAAESYDLSEIETASGEAPDQIVDSVSISRSQLEIIAKALGAEITGP